MQRPLFNLKTKCYFSTLQHKDTKKTIPPTNNQKKILAPPADQPPDQPKKLYIFLNKGLRC